MEETLAVKEQRTLLKALENEQAIKNKQAKRKAEYYYLNKCLDNGVCPDCYGGKIVFYDNCRLEGICFDCGCEWEKRSRFMRGGLDGRWCKGRLTSDFRRWIIKIKIKMIRNDALTFFEKILVRYCKVTV